MAEMKHLRKNPWYLKSVIRAIKLVTHPIFVFVSLQIVWVAITILWVIWFLNQKDDIAELATALGNKNIEPTYGIFFLTVGCILLGILLVGTVLLFVFTQRQTNFMRQQQTFVSSVTHELRSPLASLQLSFETLQNPILPLAMRDKLYEMALRDLQRLFRLVDRILLSSRLDRGIIEHEHTARQIDLDSTIDTVVDQAIYLDQNVKSRIVKKLSHDFRLWTSPQALSLVLGNLVENAIKYSPTGTPITIEAMSAKDGVVISVSDQGFGLSSKDKRKLFRMFHRSERMTKKAVPGTGLGLYIVRSTISLLGGSVWAESPGVGLGTTFYVYFPNAKA